MSQLELKRVAILIPAYNEGERLRSVLTEIPKEIEGHKVDIFVVDDCSVDNTAQIAKEHATHTVTLQQNSGVGFATRVGFETIVATSERLNTQYGVVLKIDGDGQHLTNHLVQIFTALNFGLEFVTCSRFHANSPQEGTPVDRQMLNESFAWQISLKTGLSITDARTGLMGFRYNLIEQIASELITARYGVPMEIILRIWAKNPNVRFEKIVHPAMYSNVSRKLGRKYCKETFRQKAKRWSDAAEVLIRVSEDLDAQGVVFANHPNFVQPQQAPIALSA